MHYQHALSACIIGMQQKVIIIINIMQSSRQSFKAGPVYQVYDWGNLNLPGRSAGRAEQRRGRQENVFIRRQTNNQVIVAVMMMSMMAKMMLLIMIMLMMMMISTMALLWCKLNPFSQDHIYEDTDHGWQKIDKKMTWWWWWWSSSLFPFLGPSSFPLRTDTGQQRPADGGLWTELCEVTLQSIGENKQ